ncbi:hypothetical protein PanWU01x14_267120 [Parasponia andersonii]|uniref:Transmembrane protein n=1 Tax=Parasponia andersonii TaxID=3476 RepID=A0A2P5B6K3_PARAD|nr:hypothetical protein PanWU01x14_267120 [Parasponia andersonii]
MRALTKNPNSVDVLKAVVVTLILSAVLTSKVAATAEVPAVAPVYAAKEGEDSKKFEMKSEENEYQVAMPLYRVKDKPGVLIPGSKIQASTTFFPGNTKP